MSIDSVYEQWERQVKEKAREEGIELGVKRTLRRLYEARFGALPGALASAIEATHDSAKLEQWMVLIGTRSQEEITAAMQAGASAP